MKRAIQNRKLLTWLQDTLSLCSSVLDVGCGNKWYWSQINNIRFVGADAWDSFEPDYLIDLEQSDLPSLEFFDACLMLDFVEHVEKQRGLELIEQAKRLADTVIVLTPLNWSKNEESYKDQNSDYYQNHFDLHKSLWTADDFKGFERVFGIMSNKYFLGVWNAS